MCVCVWCVGVWVVSAVDEARAMRGGGGACGGAVVYKDRGVGREEVGRWLEGREEEEYERGSVTISLSLSWAIPMHFFGTSNTDIRVDTRHRTGVHYVSRVSVRFLASNEWSQCGCYEQESGLLKIYC